METISPRVGQVDMAHSVHSRRRSVLGKKLGAIALSIVTLSGVGVVALATVLASPAGAAAYTKGDLFLSVGGGQVQERRPNGTLVQTLQDPDNSQNTGSAFDKNGNLFVTEFSNQNVGKFNPTGGFVSHFGSGYSADPESIVFDKNGNMYVGQADGSHQILKFSPSGTLLDSYSPAVGDRGTDWIELAADQCTMHYTSESKEVKAFNVCTNAQLPDFATNLPGPYAFAHRILSDGGELVANTDRVVRLNSSGAVIKTYTPSVGGSYLFGLNRDPDGTTFWTADIQNGNVFHFDIASGAQLGMWSAGTGVSGISLFGEITVSNPPPPATSTCAGTGTRGCIFQLELRHCSSMHVGYSHFTDGTVVHWNVYQNKVRMGGGSFAAIGGGPYGASSYHFLTQPIANPVQPRPKSNVHFWWTIRNVDYKYSFVRACEP